MLERLRLFFYTIQQLEQLTEATKKLEAINRMLEAALQKRDQTLQKKEQALQAYFEVLRSKEASLQKRMFDCDVREVLIEAREATQK